MTQHFPEEKEKQQRRKKFLLFLKRSWFWLLSGFLTVLALAQASLLFGNPFAGEKNTEAETEEIISAASILQPSDIYVTLGGREKGSYVHIGTADEGMTSLSGEILDLLAACLQEASPEEADPEEISGQVLSCWLKLPMEANTDLLCAQCSLKEGTLPEMSFNMIYLAPSVKRGESVLTFLLNTETGEAWKMSAGEREWEENLTVYSDLLETGGELFDGAERYTEWTAGFGGSEETKQRGFFVQDSSLERSMERGSLSCAFRSEGTLYPGRMKTYGLSFFEYPDEVTVTESDDTETFSNEKITLKLTSDGYMHYVETPTDTEKGELTLNEAYQKAFDFLQSDLASAGSAGEAELSPVLSACEYLDGDYVFYFDYMVNGTVIDLSVMPEGMEDMEHPVQIVVRGSIVHECRRWVLKVDLREEVSTLKDSWLSAADYGVSEAQKKGTGLAEPPELVYHYTGHALLISWRLKLNSGEILYLAE